MIQKLSTFLDRVSEFIAERKGLLPLVGIVLVILNLILQIFPVGWISTSNLFLHFGVILAVLGMLLAWAL